MKKLLLGFIAGLLLGGLAVWWRTSAAPSADATVPTAAMPLIRRIGLELSAEQFAAAGITTAVPSPLRLVNHQTGYARVIDPAPLFVLVAEVEAAEAASVASEKELARLRQLNATGDNVSARAVETAEASTLRDRSLLASAQARLRTGWGDPLSEQKSREALLSDLSTGATALVRVDVPTGESPTRPPHEVQLERLTGNAAAEPATVLGPVLQADPQFQGRGYLTVMRNPPPPGTLLRALIPTGGPDTAALSVPSSAILRHQGRTMVYVETAERTYESRSVTLGHSAAGDAAILDGLSANERVVVTGAQQLLSHEQLSAQNGS
jgi:hypothetical protein